MTTRDSNLQLALPPFRGWLRRLVIFSTSIYIVILLLMSFAPSLGKTIVVLGLLSHDTVLRGWYWQPLTYGFVNVDPLNFVLAMLGVYFLGGAVESEMGSRRFVQLYIGSLVLAGLGGIALSFIPRIADGAAFGPGPAANAILMAFFLLHPNASIVPIPIPIQIPVRYIVIFAAAIQTAYLLLNHFALFYIVQLLGLAAGYALFLLLSSRRVARVPVRGVMGRGLSDGVPVGGRAEASQGPLTRLKNAYYKWKRRRAARKFEVYMREHNRDVKFDEHGNFIPPEEKPRKDNGEGKGGWVN